MAFRQSWSIVNGVCSVFGDVKENKVSGIFGNYTKEINKNNLYKVADYEDIKLGEAKIITVIEGTLKKEYSVNILKVNNDKTDNKNTIIYGHGRQNKTIFKILFCTMSMTNNLLAKLSSMFNNRLTS